VQPLSLSFSVVKPAFYATGAPLPPARARTLGHALPYGGGILHPRRFVPDRCR